MENSNLERDGPAASSEWISSARNPGHDLALMVLKGAVCITLSLPTGRSTRRVKTSKNCSGVLTVGPLESAPPSDALERIQKLCSSFISERRPVTVFVIPREVAARKYGEAFLDEFGLPSSVKEVRIASLREWNLNANRFPILQTSDCLASLAVTKLHFAESKKQLDVHFTFRVAAEIEALSVELAPLCSEKTVAEEELPALQTLLPPSGASEPGVAEGGSGGGDGLIVTPWEVKAEDGGINYDKLLWAAVSAQHLLPALPREAFDVPLVIQLTDDEKFLFKENLSLEETQRLAFENARDIIACGFDVEKTFIFANSEYIQHLYGTVLEIQKKVTFNQARGIFGFGESDNIGKVAFPAVQAAPAFSRAFPSLFGGDCSVRCLIPQAIDQDPYFRMTRDVAVRLGLPKPSLLHSRFIPALQGSKTKMSGSVGATSIYVSDSPQEIKTKINKYAFSGGQATLEEQREKGANLDVDVPYQYLTFFLEDDKELEAIGTAYKAGRMSTGQVKERLIAVLQEVVETHQKRRAQVSDEMVRLFMNPHREAFKRFWPSGTSHCKKE